MRAAFWEEPRLSKWSHNLPILSCKKCHLKVCAGGLTTGCSAVNTTVCLDEARKEWKSEGLTMKKSGNLKVSPWKELQQTSMIISKVPVVLSEQTSQGARHAWLTLEPKCPMTPPKPAEVLLRSTFKDMKMQMQKESRCNMQHQPSFSLHQPLLLSHTASSSLLERGSYGPSGPVGIFYITVLM